MSNHPVIQKIVTTVSTVILSFTATIAIAGTVTDLNLAKSTETSTPHSESPNTTPKMDQATLRNYPQTSRTRTLTKNNENLPTSKTPAPSDVTERGLWLKEVLYEAGFRGEALRTAWAVAMKESTGRPKAHNDNAASGDNSYGIFQINMIGDLGPARREKFNLKSNKELFNPLKNAKIAHYMTDGGKNWSSWDIDESGYNGGVSEPKYREWLAKYPKG